METIVLPNALSAFIGSEAKEFSVKSKRDQPIKKSLSLIAFGIIWLGMTAIIPLTQIKEFKKENLQEIIQSIGGIIPFAFTGLFSLIGIIVLILGIIMFFKKGTYFVGTPTRLVNFKKENIRSIDWEQFSGNIEVSGNKEKGNIKLEMRTGQVVQSKNGERYIPNIIYILGIPNAYKIAEICRKRIKKNDPTPTKS